MDSQKGVLCNDDSRNQGDEPFSDKSHHSKTTYASSLATTVSDSANFEGMELVAGHCRARSRARTYDNRWVVCTGPHTCKRVGYKEKREKGVMGKPGRWGNSTSCTFESLRDTELETTPNIGGAKKMLKPRQA
jgi:hypothetical protein